MSKPTILAVDDDPEVAAAITPDLRSRYGAGPDVVRDGNGFVVTGQDLLGSAHAGRWALPRAPFALETSVPGVFVAGDVRLDSMKRVASAVGEGAMSIYLVHRYLATM